MICCDFLDSAYVGKRSFAMRDGCFLNCEACCLVFSSSRIALREILSFFVHDEEIQNHLENPLSNINYSKTSNHA